MRKALIVLLGLFILRPVNSFASENKVTITGRVISKTLKTYSPDARIVLIDRERRMIDRVNADSDGNFRLLAQIPSDTYELIIATEGYFLTRMNFEVTEDTIIELSTIELQEDPSQFPFMGTGLIHQQICELLKLQLAYNVPRPRRFRNEIWYVYLRQQGPRSVYGYESRNDKFLKTFKEALIEKHGFKIISDSSKANAFIELKPVRFPNGHISHVVVAVTYQDSPSGTPTLQVGSGIRLSDYSFAKMIAKKLIGHLPVEYPQQ